MSRITVVGAGAIGSAVAVRLAATGHRLSMVARGVRREAIEATGLVLREEGETLQARPSVGMPSTLGPQDIVILAVKSQALPGLLPALEPLIGRDTFVVPMVNGVPWWYFLGEKGPYAGRSVAAVDPDRKLVRLIDPSRLIGCVVFSSASLTPTGECVVSGRQNLCLGAINGRRFPAVLSDLFTTASIDVKISDDIRAVLWTKIALNTATNPLSMLTGATLSDIVGVSGLREIMKDVLNECVGLAERVGRPVALPPDAMIEMTREKGAFETSMLQDFRRGKPIELAGIGDAVIEIADLVGHSMPVTRMIVDLARHRAVTALGDPRPGAG